MTRAAAAEPFDRRAEAAHIADARGLGVPLRRESARLPSLTFDLVLISLRK